MSPEQVNAEPVDQRTDVWSLGATLYEMLAGRPPFDADHPLALMQAIGSKEPTSVRVVKPDLPDEIDRIVRRALAKSPAARYPSATALAQALTELRTQLTAPVIPAGARTNAPTRRVMLAAAAIAVLAVTASVAWSLNRSATLRAARERVQEVARLVDADDYTAAFRVAEEVERVLPDDPALRELWPHFSRTISITTTPAGARVSTRSYGDKTEAWRNLGSTPLDRVRVPVGLRRWRFERDGAATLQAAFPAVGPITIPLERAVEEGEVFVQGGRVNSWITGIDPIERIEVPNYRIGKFEVTNKQFKNFVQANGYRTREYWEHPFVIDGATVPWEKAVARFVDATGRPGPATWELGDYPARRDNHPVTGISWREAAAFAKFAGKRLPTVTHWIRAAGTDFAANISPLSNLQNSAAAAVGSFEGMGPFGTYDMAGNVREWCWNAWGNERYILGAAWTDPSYMFTHANVLSPWDRSPANGVRLASYPDATPEAALAPVERLFRDYTKETPVNDELFETYRRQFTYDPAPLNVKSEPAPPAPPDARLEKVSFDAAYGKNRMVAYVYLPVSGTPPYQPVIFFPGSSSIGQSSPPADIYALFAVKSGRALIVPAYRGTFDRRDGLSSTWPDKSQRYREYAMNWVQDFTRTLEYMSTRSDLDMNHLAYFGFSWGGRWGAIFPAIEPRIKAVVLFAGGLASGTAQPELDQINFVTRVRQPVLMLNGKFDAIEPVDTAQRPMFERLGTPKDDKRWVVFDDDHGLPGHRNEVVREALAWLDRYVGPVK